MAIIIDYNPSTLFDKALFNFDEIINTQNFRLSGVVKVSVSDPFTISNYLKHGAIPSIYTNQIFISTWTITQLSNFQSILDSYSQFINLSFSKIVNLSGLNPADVGASSDINLSAIYRTSLDFAGMAAIPTAPFGYIGSELDIVLNTAAYSDTSLATTTFSGHVLMHEIGHVLGLSHPHREIVNGKAILTSDFTAIQNAGFSQLGFVIRNAADLNKEFFTIMSYDDQRPISGKNTYAQTPMILDVLALQACYGFGPGTSQKNNDIITPGAGGTVDSYRTYFDVGGFDQINLINYSEGAYLNMGVSINEAPYKVGVSMSFADYQLMINGADPKSLRWFYGEFENSRGSRANDLIIGNDFNNQISGGFGNDVINGGAGIDIAIYSGFVTEYFLKTGKTSIDVTDKIINRDGIDTLTSVERLKFNDASIALDVGKDQSAGTAYMLYRAALAREPDKEGLGFWISALDRGGNIYEIAKEFITNPEYIAKYGVNNSNSEFVSNLYRNVLNRALDKEGFDYWVKGLDSGATTRPIVLQDFASSPENVTQVASLVVHGIVYSEWMG